MQSQTEVTSNTTTAQAAEFIPVTIWPHPWPTQGAWRAMIFAADARKTSKGTIRGNGLIEAGAIRRVGRRVLVNPSRFFAWVESQGVKKA